MYSTSGTPAPPGAIGSTVMTNTPATPLGQVPQLARQALRANDQDQPHPETDEEHPAEHEVADDEGVLDGDATA